MDQSTKRCLGCGETKPLALFTGDRSRPDGRKSRCKACDHARAKATRDAHRAAQVAMRFSRQVVDRVVASVICDIPTHCWVSTLGRRASGYSQVWIGGGYAPAHRITYAALIGPIAPGLEVDHLCRNKTCCNPSHLEAVPHHINVLRGAAPAAVNARKTHCARGHEFTPDNTYINSSRPSAFRVCLTCQRALDRRRRPPKTPRD